MVKRKIDRSRSLKPPPPSSLAVAATAAPLGNSNEDDILLSPSAIPQINITSDSSIKRQRTPSQKLRETQHEDSNPAASASPVRKRGRPKGSKTKKRNGDGSVNPTSKSKKRKSNSASKSHDDGSEKAEPEPESTKTMLSNSDAVVGDNPSEPAAASSSSSSSNDELAVAVAPPGVAVEPFAVNSKVQVWYDDSWWNAEILSRRKHRKGDDDTDEWRYKVFYPVDRSEQSHVPHALIRNKEKRGKTHAPPIAHDDDDDDNDDDNNSDNKDEDFDHDDDADDRAPGEESEDDDLDNDDDDDGPPRKPAPQRSASGTNGHSNNIQARNHASLECDKGNRSKPFTLTKESRAARPQPQPQPHALESSSEDDDSSVGPTPVANRRHPGAKAAAKSSQRDGDDDELEDSDGDHVARPASGRRRPLQNQSRHDRPTRASARKAQGRLSLGDGGLTSTDDDDDDVKAIARKSEREHDSDDFIVDDEASDESLDLTDGNSSDDGDDHNAADDDRDVVEITGKKASSSGKKEKTSKNAGYVDDNDIGTADDDSDDDAGPHASPQLNLNSTRKRPMPMESPTRATNRLYDDSDDDSDNDDGNRGANRAKIPMCDSQVDVITDEPLPALHVCFVTPDGQSKQCFCLETLRKIALTTGASASAAAVYHTNNAGQRKQTFKQPPHFRSVASDELLDQIASRFGREALDLHGSFYTRSSPDTQNALATGAGQPVEYRVDAQSRLDSFDDFLECVQNYVNRQMGNQDLYACPLCYTVAHQRLQLGRKPTPVKQRGESSEERVARTYATHFKFDPMHVLSSIDDDDKCQVAAAFCFTRASQIKVHLRNDHGVKTSNVHGNELYEAFKIRGQDGLLQRFIKDRFRESKQGYLQRYWNEGNNFAFVQLLNLVRHSTACRDVLGGSSQDEEGREKAEEFLQPALDFWDTISDDASALWQQISQPYDIRADDMDDFLADDNDDEQDDAIDPGVAFRAQRAKEFRDSLEQDQAKIDRYRYLEEELKRAESDEGDSDGKAEAEIEEEIDDEEDRSEQGAELDDVANGGYFEELSSSDDEWVNKRRSSFGSRRKSTASCSSGRPHKLGRPQVTADDSATGLSSDDSVLLTAETKASASTPGSRFAIADSDDE